MKLCFTISDGNGAFHLGLGIERSSVVVEIPESSIPKQVKDFYSRKAWAAEDPQHRHAYETLEISVLEE